MIRLLLPVILIFLAGIAVFAQNASPQVASPKTTVNPNSTKPIAIASPSPKPVGDLSLTPNDLRIELSNDGGYILFIRKKPDIKSILLTESTEDPGHKMASYALRSKEANVINGEPQRRLDGEMLAKKDLHFLLSSTPVSDAQFGLAFRIFVPYVVVYGYPWGRYGERAILDGSYLSIRAFSLPYADYDGAYKDNPYALKISQAKLDTPPVVGYNKETVKAFTALTSQNAGKLYYSKGEADLIPSLAEILNSVSTDAVDLVFCLDATESLGKDAVYVREKLVPMLRTFSIKHEGSRYAIIQYRDYMEEFLYKVTPFTTDFSILQNAIDGYQPAGGRDIPEAVNEALYASLTELDWALKDRIIMLVGDAPPHPIARGTVTADMVNAEANKNKVKIEALVLPN